ncbi:MAG: YbjQ family protein [Planctomycetota bacterium]
MSISRYTQITTGTSIDGWEIEEHLGLVSCHAVAGTGLFSDIAAAFRDTFGGRSEGYRRQLQSLYSEVLSDLVQQAALQSANWLIGLRIDIDEISGQGKQMFMITGLATAVRARCCRAPAVEEHSPNGDLRISHDQIRIAIRRAAILQSLRTLSQPPSAEDFSFLSQHRVADAGALLVQVIARTMHSTETELDPWILKRQSDERSVLENSMLRYLTSLDPATATEILFTAISDEETAQTACSLLNRSPLGSLRHSLALLQASDPRLRRWGLQTLQADQQGYSLRDLQTIDKLLASIPEYFPDLFVKVQTRTLLGGQRMEIRCPCGYTNPAGTSVCAACERDRFGFLVKEFNPQQAVQHLQTLRSALEQFMPGKP